MDPEVVKRLIKRALELCWGPSEERLKLLAAEPEMDRALVSITTRGGIELGLLLDALAEKGYSQIEISTLAAVAGQPD